MKERMWAIRVGSMEWRVACLLAASCVVWLVLWFDGIGYLGRLREDVLDVLTLPLKRNMRSK